LRNHNEWHSFSSKAGFISIRRGFVKALISKLSEEEVRMLAMEIATTSNRDFLLILKNKVSIDSAIDFVDSWLRTSGFVYRRQSNARGTYSFVLQHDLGRKWS